MKKGIGAAPFAIVAALIIALAGGLWATQPAQAAAGDVVLSVTDVAGGDINSFVDPDADVNDVPFGPAGRMFELALDIEDGTGDTATALEAGFVGTDNVFRGEIGRGAASWVEFQAAISNSPDDTTTATTGPFSVSISVTGQASLAPAATLTTATCASQRLTTNGTPTQVCQFPVYSNGTPGAFTVTASGAGAGLLTSSIGDDDSKNGQWVGEAATADALTGAPASATAVDKPLFVGTMSPAVFLSGTGEIATVAGLDAAGEVGYLFQLKDSAGQVAMITDPENTVTGGRDDLLLAVVVDTGDKVTIAPAILSAGTATGSTSQYVDIQQATGFGSAADSGYPGETSADRAATGGLIGVGLLVEVGQSSIGRITIGLAGGTFEYPFSVAGDPDADMSTVGPAGTPVNLGPGDSHKRMVTLRDKNGVLVPLPANVANVADSGQDESDNSSSDDLIVPSETDTADSKVDLLFSVGNAASTGVYPIEITANYVETDDPGDDAEPVGRVDGMTRAADIGVHAFTVTIRNLADGKDVVDKRETDVDDNPIEAHVGGPVTGLSVTSVTTLAGGELLTEGGGTQIVNAGTSRLLTITLSAVGKDGLAPANGEAITAVTTSGGSFVGANVEGVVPGETNDAGEASVRYVFGGEAASTTLVFTSGTGEAVLIVAAGDDAAAVGPVIYSLVDSAASTFVTWQGGDVSSSVFENVADLVRVWKWTGTMWVGYNSNPAAPAGTKTNFILSNNDIIYVVSNGPVSLSLG